MDYTKLLERLSPIPDGETSVRMRSGIIDATNMDGTVDVEVSGVIVPSVAVLDGATAGIGDVVHILVWGGDMLVLGAVAT